MPRQLNRSGKAPRSAPTARARMLAAEEKWEKIHALCELFMGEGYESKMETLSRRLEPDGTEPPSEARRLFARFIANEYIESLKKASTLEPPWTQLSGPLSLVIRPLSEIKF